MSMAWLLASIACEVTGTLGMRASDGFRRRAWIAPIVLSYAAAFVFLSLALAGGMPVGIAYGVWTAVGIVLVALIARAVWSEPLTRRMLAGIAEYERPDPTPAEPFASVTATAREGTRTHRIVRCRLFPSEHSGGPDRALREQATPGRAACFGVESGLR